MPVPRAAPAHLQPPPSVPRAELARLGIKYLSPMRLRDMIRARNEGQFALAIVDLRDADFVGGHIPGCVNIPSRTFISRIDRTIEALGHANLIVFHCLISMHRAPMCAKLYKERLFQLGQDQNVAILEGGFSQWRELFTMQPWAIEDECFDMENEQQYALGFGLGQQFVADVRAGFGQSQRVTYGNTSARPYFGQSSGMIVDARPTPRKHRDCTQNCAFM
mmetsp:Transcript_68967/g.127044  ORF Transcript_68967/g.127044 Transcript_68967/m.127044 type:complete len:220 (-) Transcript_68967:63-722(-)